MKHAPRPQSISWFQDHYRASRLTLRPPFQRKPVWTDKQRHNLIESILMDIPVPEIYIQVAQTADGSESYAAVDGQQRLRTILQFIGIEREEDQEGEDVNGFRLDKLAKTSQFSGVAFADLDSEKKLAFYRYEICMRFLYTDSQSEVEDIFKRLNKYTLPLKAQELRNATYHGALVKLAEKYADDEYWAVNRIVTPASIRRMGDIEMMSDLIIGVIDGPQGGAAGVIDGYYEAYEVFEDELPEQAQIRRRFEDALERINKLFPKISEAPRWGNRADFYSLFVALASLAQEGYSVLSIAAARKSLIEFGRSVDLWLKDNRSKVGAHVARYARAIQKGSNDKARRAERHDVLRNLVAPHFKKQPD